MFAANISTSGSKTGDAAALRDGAMVHGYTGEFGLKIIDSIRQIRIITV